MAKRAAPDEKPYRPLLDAELVSAALSNNRPSAQPTVSSSAKILEMPRHETQRPEPTRRVEQPNDFEISPRDAAPRAIDPDPPRHTAELHVDKFDQEKRILFTRRESQGIDRMVVSLASRLNSQVKVSHVIRALVGLLLNAEGEIDRRAGDGGPLVRPANGDAQALQNFEREIGRIIIAGLRDAGPVR